MPVFVQNLQQSVFVNIHRLLHAAEFFLSCLRLQKYEVGVACEETAVVRELNRKYRLKDIATDVLSFPQKEVVIPGVIPNSEPWDISLGDIVLAMPFIHQQCREEDTNVDERLPVCSSRSRSS
jgi:rRNA maturation RNase YbeY